MSAGWSGVGALSRGDSMQEGRVAAGRGGQAAPGGWRLEQQGGPGRAGLRGVWMGNLEEREGAGRAPCLPIPQAQCARRAGGRRGGSCPAAVQLRGASGHVPGNGQKCSDWKQVLEVELTMSAPGLTSG